MTIYRYKKNMKYREVDAISQSRLKLLTKGPAEYLENTDLKGANIDIGSLFDCKLLTPDRTAEEFYITDLPDISDNIKEVWDEYYENRKVLGNFYVDKEVLDNIAISKGYRVTQKNARLQYVLNDIAYYNILVENNGRTIISSSINEKVDEMIRSVKTNKFTKDIINNITKTQVEIYFKLKGFKFDLKALLDWIEIDEENKTIRPYDLKSMYGNTYNFKYSFYKYRYDFQAAFYTTALKVEYPEYTILPFRFLVESTSNPGAPLIYEVSDYVLQVGAFGGNIDGKDYRGFIQCLEDLKWHTEKNIWNYKREDYTNNGLLIL